MQLKVEGSKPFLLRLYTFYFPGWQARIDGEKTDIEIGAPEGFIVVPVPAGSHQVDVKFGSTPDRFISAVVSLFSLAAIGWIAWRMPKRVNGESGSEDEDADESGSNLIPAAIVLLILFSLQILGGDRYGWFHRHSTNEVTDPAVSSTNILFGDEITLIGYELANRGFQAGDQIGIDLYWRANKPLDDNYQVFAHLLDSGGNVIAQSDKLNPGDYPTERWPTDKYVLDRHTINIPVRLTTGPYRLGIGLWLAENGDRLEIIGSGEEGSRDIYIIPELLVPERLLTGE
jgi:hypothetical protein